MLKLNAILPMDPSNPNRVIPGDLTEVVDHFKIKVNGVTHLVEDQVPYYQCEIKEGDTLPDGMIIHHSGDVDFYWAPLDEDNTIHKKILEGYRNFGLEEDGLYECIGPKIKGNPHQEDVNIFIPMFYDNLKYDVDMDAVKANPYSYFLNLFKENFPYEGLLACDKDNNIIGEIARSHFGFKNGKFNQISKLFNIDVSLFKINKIASLFNEAAENYHSCEMQSAPSGEFEEYNSSYLRYEAVYETYKEILRELNVEFVENFDQENGKYIGLSFELK